MSEFDEMVAKKEAQDRAWEIQAKKNNWDCTNCGSLIIRDDEEVYYRTNMCGLCDKRVNQPER